ncbi:Short transient receptor putative channel 2-like [Desmophyllum pertusum]|uniref:Short transient receptor putative channel 2-like n=1 Tax=Desmophyllum pertusum TaxID=174260 RepID=A0A9X0D728_9CNID|nr:Short transient receptor putative channel 2-like [Desmophyllum pertusum]
MAPLTFSFVVRFSSEDAIFKAGNLCNGKADATGAWKCAKEDTNCGSIEAEFQLEKASYISHIDIGNCGSAFIEILVGNSMWPPDKPFVTLLPSATLMNPPECKSWIKTHAVRMFNHTDGIKGMSNISHADGILQASPCKSVGSYKSYLPSALQAGQTIWIIIHEKWDLFQMTLSPHPRSPEGVCGKTSTTTSWQPSDEENDEDGVMRLKKASGLMGCLRGLEKGSPESPLNRAGKMLQAALDSRSPTTPRIKPRDKRSSSQSSPEIASSPESPFRKRNSQSPSEGPNEKKKKKPERKWSLAGGGDFDHELQELKALHLKELTERDGKMKILKMHMADALGDNSRERQLQLEELTKELRRVTDETDVLKSKLQSMKSSNQGKCPNCFVMERQLQSKIVELRDKEVVTIEMQQLCAKMEKQLVQQDELLRQWAKNKGKPVR